MSKGHLRLVGRLFMLCVLVAVLALILSSDRRSNVAYALSCCIDCEIQENGCYDQCGEDQACLDQCMWGVNYCWRHCTYSCGGTCSSARPCPAGYICSDFVCVPAY